MPASADITPIFIEHSGGVALAAHLDTFAARSEALAMAAEWIANRFGRALRREMYPVVENWGDQPLAQLDRAAVPCFGVKGFGVHVNGFVRKPDGIHLWVGERAKDRQVDPGKLDNMIGGGQPIGLTLRENLRKEAHEEAGIGPALADTAKEVRTLRYLVERQNGLRNDCLFVFDLELPTDFTPRNTDGEVAAFRLLPLTEVAAVIRDTDRFKFNCNIVIIDFLVRHNFIGPKEQDYQKIITYCPV